MSNKIKMIEDWSWMPILNGWCLYSHTEGRTIKTTRIKNIIKGDDGLVVVTTQNSHYMLGKPFSRSELEFLPSVIESLK